MTNQTLRRSGRIAKSVPIQLIGCDWEGTVFSERTTTVVLSLHGAGILSEQKLVAEQELTMRSLQSNREAEVRVVGEIGAQGKIHAYGVAFVNEMLDFWQVEFPPIPTDHPGELALQCSLCDSAITLQRGAFEADVCAIHGGLLRYCRTCNASTVWRRMLSGSAARPRTGSTVAKRKPGRSASSPVDVLDSASAQSTASVSSKSSDERRRRTRAKVNFFACVRTDKYGDDVVACVDMSRGGLGFKTCNYYQEGSSVRISVPFSKENPGAPAIFVPARIAYIGPIPGQDTFRCGVAFQKDRD